MSDGARLATYIETWWTSVQDFVAVAEGLSEDEWSRPTDLPGWDVKAVASHIAHLESLLAGGPEETADIGDPPHVTGPMGQFTEIGVVTRRDRSPASILDEIRTVTEIRRKQLQADPPQDGSAPAPQIFGLLGWNQRTLLRNRPLDVWMHGQDVRRAVGRPGAMDSAGGQHVADYLAEAFPFVVGKKVRPPVGTTAVLAVAGSPEIAVRVDESGRGQRLTDVGPDIVADVRIAIDRESFVLAAGGRRTPPPDAATITGDAALGRRIVEHLATTP